MRIVRLTWRDIENACRIVSTKILADHLLPEVCVAISRGGFPPSRIICDFLDIKNLASIKIEYYSDVNRTLAKPELVYPLNANVKGKRVLIVDDVADHGDSLILARHHVQDMEAEVTKVATLHYKPWSKIKPDYYAREYRSWIVYPWEVNETIRKVAQKLMQNGKSTAQIEKAMMGMKISRSEYRKVARGLLQQ